MFKVVIDQVNDFRERKMVSEKWSPIVSDEEVDWRSQLESRRPNISGKLQLINNKRIKRINCYLVEIFIFCKNFYLEQFMELWNYYGKYILLYECLV